MARRGEPLSGGEVALVALIGVQVVFQAALALGAPWGRAAWGGQHDGTVPAPFRVASALAALMWAWIGLVVARRALGPVGRRRVLLVVAVYVSIGVAANAASRSNLERSLWTPYSAVVAILAWRAWRATRRPAAVPAA